MHQNQYLQKLTIWGRGGQCSPLIGKQSSQMDFDIPKTSTFLFINIRENWWDDVWGIWWKRLL